jgi:pantothenate kinase-related protein Tda10
MEELLKKLRQKGIDLPEIESQRWSQLLPLAEFILSCSQARRPTVIGFAGLPGCGKTSLTARVSTLLRALTNESIAVVSLDDFYLTPAQRQSLGYSWRAVPGTHDLKLLNEFLASLAAEQLKIPRYDTAAEQRRPSELCRAPQFVLVEGWFVGAKIPGYEMLSEKIDYLIYLDMEVEIAHRSRLSREAKIRTASGGTEGMTHEETEGFWREALLPTAQTWVFPLKERADLIIGINDHYQFTNYSVKKKETSLDDTPEPRSLKRF